MEAKIASALTGTTVNWVNNLADLRAMAHATTAPVVVEGYGSAGDGGGGIFQWHIHAGRQRWNDHPPNDVATASPGRWASSRFLPRRTHASLAQLSLA
jgi:hypothetical protein